MNTPAHLVLSAGLFARPDAQRVTAAALFGGLLPDLSLYLIGAWSMTVGGQSAETFFRETYYSAWVQQVMAVDNSILLWALAAVLALALRSAAGVAFGLSGLLHVVTDFLLHNDDARQHFWPLSDWVFVSPVSYWDPDHHGTVFGALETMGVLAILTLLWRRFEGRLARTVIAVAAVAQLAPMFFWAIVFA